MEVRFKRLSANAVLPAYQSEHAAGMDLHAALSVPMPIAPGEIVRVPTGLAVSIPPGYEGQIRPRSGLATRAAVTVPNAPGTIDADYRGEIQVALINLGGAPFIIEPKMRVAQLVVTAVARCAVQEVDELDETVRGAGGFGSTGQ